LAQGAGYVQASARGPDFADRQGLTANRPVAHCLRHMASEMRMGVFAAFRETGSLYELYARFELLISAILLIFVSILIIYSTVVLAGTLFTQLTDYTHFADITVLKDIFGLILTILIMVEFNHSIVLSIRQRIGVLQVRVIVMITIVVIARKLILLDYSSVTWPTLLGFGGLALVLGALYWLLSEVESRRRAAGLPDE
jgi:uncharacterized membrane protein (DUF373 family)